jgi:hypothetical protein
LAVRGGFLPPAILCAALGLVLAFIPLRQAVIAATLMTAAMLVVLGLGLPAEWIEAAFLGCWLSVISCALLLIRPHAFPQTVYFAAAANAGLWAGAVISTSGRWRDLAVAVPCVLLLVPGRHIVARGWGIGLKVLASWLTAVAILATMVSFTPTPGYESDHME